jgi:hypothetical protein
MDAHRFDALLRSVAAAASRRGLLFGLASVLLGIGPFVPGLEQAVARKTRKKKKKKKKKRGTSPASPCTPTCATSNACGPDGCGGSCGTCGAPATCDGAGTCKCPNNQAPCGGSAVCCVAGLQFCGGTTCEQCVSLGGTCTTQGECCQVGFPTITRDCQDPPGGASGKICCQISGQGCGQDDECCSGACLLSGLCA